MTRPALVPAQLPGFLPSELAISLSGAMRCETVYEDARTVWHIWGAVHQPAHETAPQPAVVLLHGGSGSWTHWVRSIAPLRDAGWQVVVPDLPGFGDSDLPIGCTDVDALPAHVHAGLVQLQNQGWALGPVAVAGFSFGGMAGALWLAQYPHDAQRLVLVGAPGLGLTVRERVALKGWRHLPSPHAQEQVHRHNLMALMLQQPQSLDALALALHTANVQRDRMPRRRLSSTDILAQTLPRLGVTVSAIYGEHDALYRGRLPEVQSALQALSTHWGQWHSVPGAGHWVPYEAAGAFHVALCSVLTEALVKP
jgi:pimeloyl-ACP methyl ester carboxylesterase